MTKFLLRMEECIIIIQQIVKARGRSIISFFNTLIFLIIFLPVLANAANEKLPIPRFASIKSNEVNARTGPTIKCPIEWVFVKKGEPVEIIAEYEQWRQIRDINGEGGWVHSSVLSGKRSVIILGKEIIALLKSPEVNNQLIAKVTPNTRCQLNKCKNNWCRISCKNYNGWVFKNILWGVYKK